MATTGCCESLRILLRSCAPPGSSRRTQRVACWIPPGRARRRSVLIERFLCSHQLWAPPGQAGRKPTPGRGGIGRRPFFRRRRGELAVPCIRFRLKVSHSGIEAVTDRIRRTDVPPLAFIVVGRGENVSGHEQLAAWRCLRVHRQHTRELPKWQAMVSG